MNDPDRTLPPDPDRTHVTGGSGGAGGARLPEKVGRYRPLRILGQGGMGVVYEAEQEEPRRRVALKVIRPELATPDLRRRFAHESVFLGRLQHPGIAQVYEAGTAETPDGPVPFIAMELIEGLPLNTWARTHDPDRRTRIELMIGLCDAVQHAHQRGLIHRDLKPGNVLVDGSGRPRVLDFGVARPHDADLETSLVTTHGELVGTLSYMAPEQLSGDPNDIDTRCDIYALGVILYELLSGAPPLALAGRSLEEVLRTIRDDDPEPLASHEPGLAGDLTVIAAKAMAKDRALRYASANGLGMDLRRFLDDEPIAARPPSTMYQLRKFARRHRPLVIGAAGVAAALVIGAAISTWQAVRATRAEQLARTRLDQAESVTGFLQDMLAAVQPEEAQGRDVTVQEVLDRAAKDLDAGGLQAQPEVEIALRRTLGVTYRSLGRLEPSATNLRRGLALADSLLPKAAPERERLVLALAHTELRQGQDEQAEQRLSAELDRLPKPSSLAADAYSLLADYHYGRGRWQVADSLRHFAQTIIESLADPDSLPLASLLIHRAFIAEQQRDLGRAQTLTDRAAAIYRARYDAGDPRMIHVLFRQGDIAKSAGRYADCVPVYEQAWAIAQANYPEDHLMRADCLWRLGTGYLAVSRLDEAALVNEQVIAIRRKVLGPDHRDIALALSSLGTVNMYQGRFDEAEARMREALAMRERLFGRVHAAVVASLDELGGLARARRRPAQAEKLFVEADSLIAQLPEATGELAVENTFLIAMSRQDQGDHAGAEPAFRRALELQKQIHGVPSAPVAQYMSNVATNLFYQGRKSEAADLQRDAVTMFRDVGATGSGPLLALGNTAFMLDDAGRHAESDSLHRAYIALAPSVYGQDSSQQSDARARYCDNLIARKLWSAAEAQYDSCLAWRVANLPADDDKLCTGAGYLAEIRAGQGRYAQADSLITGLEAFLESAGDKLDPRVKASAEKRVARVREALRLRLAVR